MSIAIIACMKNEGMFATEWIAYHKALGFDQFFIFTNDCSDGTTDLLDALEKEGEIIHLRNKLEPGQKAQKVTLARAMNMPEVKAFDWVFHIDVDEFLVIHDENPRIDKYLSGFEDTDAIAVMWRYFGDNGYNRYNGGLVHERFMHTHERVLFRAVFHKTIFRPNEFESATAHMPKRPIKGESAVVKNAEGAVLDNASVRKRGSRYNISRPQMNWKGACLHHYSIRSTDLFLSKKNRGASNSSAEKYALEANPHIWGNQNKIYCGDALKISDLFHQEYERLLAMRGVREAIRKSEDWFFETRAKNDHWSVPIGYKAKQKLI